MVVDFLIIPLRMGGRTLLIGPRGALVRQTSGRATSQETIGSFGHKYGIRYGLGKKLHLCGQYGTRPLQSTNGGPALHRCPFPNNVCFVFLIRVNQSNINFGIASKRGELGDGLHVSCKTSAGFDLATTSVLIGNKLFLVKGSPKSMVRRFKFGIFLGGLPFGPSGSNVMIRFSTRNSGRLLESSIGFGMNLLSTPKRLGLGC